MFLWMEYTLKCSKVCFLSSAMTLAELQIESGHWDPPISEIIADALRKNL